MQVNLNGTMNAQKYQTGFAKGPRRIKEYPRRWMQIRKRTSKEYQRPTKIEADSQQDSKDRRRLENIKARRSVGLKGTWAVFVCGYIV